MGCALDLGLIIVSRAGRSRGFVAGMLSSPRSGRLEAKGGESLLSAGSWRPVDPGGLSLTSGEGDLASGSGGQRMTVRPATAEVTIE